MRGIAKVSAFSGFYLDYSISTQESQMQHCNELSFILESYLNVAMPCTISLEDEFDCKRRNGTGLTNRRMDFSTSRCWRSTHSTGNADPGTNIENNHSYIFIDSLVHTIPL